MSYIGKSPVAGNFVKLDTITTSATTTFNLLNGGVAYYPQSANNCLVSLNGILQAPTDSYTISGSTIIFSNALTTSDVIDFIIVLGDVLSLATVSDSTIGLAKLTATGTPSSSTFLRGDNSWASAGATAGQVIQVVSTNKTDTFSSTSTGSGTDVTGMSVNITPSSASNKILVMCSVNIAVGGAGEADILRSLKVVKVISGSTTNSSPVNDNNGSKNNWTVFNQRSVFDKNGVLHSTMQYLDSPATTTAITYKLQFGTGENAQAGTLYVNRTDADNYMRGASTITAMEIKG